jgi:hypothetical protein
MSAFKEPSQSATRPHLSFPPAFTDSLKALEHQLGTMDEGLISGDAPAFEASAAELGHQLAKFSLACQALPEPLLKSRVLKSRLRALGVGLALQRENMARRAVTVDRELHAILPARRVPTYGPATGGYGGPGVHGQGGRAPGSFASLRA